MPQATAAAQTNTERLFISEDGNRTYFDCNSDDGFRSIVTAATHEHERDEILLGAGITSYKRNISIARRVMARIDDAHERPDYFSELVAPGCEYWCAVY